MDRYFGEDLPQGILPMELSGITQDWLLGNATYAEGGISAENPQIFIKKKAIFLEIQLQDEKSDFFSIKDLLETYPGDEILLLFDDECCFGAKFLLCYSEDAKSTILQMMKEEAECCYVPIQPKEWKSLGSDATMADFTVVNNRKRVDKSVLIRKNLKSSIFTHLQQLAVKLRAPATIGGPRRAGQQLRWSEVSYISLRPEDDQTPAEIADSMETPSTHEVKVQAVPELVNAVAQTTLRHPRNAWTQFQPQLFKESQLEEIYESPGVKSFLQNVTDRVVDGLVNNELVDCFRRDWAILREPLDRHRDSTTTLSRSTSKDSAVEDGDFSTEGSTKTVEPPGADKVDGITASTCLHYLNMCDGKTVSSISVHPENPDIIGASYRESEQGKPERPKVQRQAKRRMRPPPGFALIWSLRDPVRPQAILEAPSEILCFSFNPKDGQIAAGSLENGSVILWKVPEFVSTSGGGPSMHPSGRGSNEQHGMMTDAPLVIPWSLTCVINHCHRGTVTDLHWLPGDLRLSDTLQLSYWTSDQAGRNEEMDDPDMMLASDFASLTKREPRFFLMTVGMDSVVRLWQFEMSMLDGATFEQNTGKTGKMARKVSDSRYRWEPLAEVMFQESAKKPILGVMRARLIPTDAAKTRYSMVQTKGRGKAENEPRSSSPRQQKGDDTPSLIVGVTDSGVMFTGDLKNGRRDDIGGQKMQYISPLSMLTQVLGNPVALVQNPGKSHERVFLWVSSASWAVCVSDGSVPALSTAGPAHESMMFYTSAAWIPWRPSAFILGTRDGSLHVWDLLRDTSRAVASDKFGVSQIISLEFIDETSTMFGTGKEGHEKSHGKRSAKMAQQQASSRHRLIIAGNSNGEIHVANVTNVEYLQPFSPAEAASFADGIHLGRVCPATKKATDLMPPAGD